MLLCENFCGMYVHKFNKLLQIYEILKNPFKYFP